jgi:hypothetical protein
MNPTNQLTKKQLTVPAFGFLSIAGLGIFGGFSQTNPSLAFAQPSTVGECSSTADTPPASQCFSTRANHLNEDGQQCSAPEPILGNPAETGGGDGSAGAAHFNCGNPAGNGNHAP